MEWVETTGRTIEEAKEAALDELGVDERDAEFEVIEEPKLGLFGRVRVEGRVRARVRPTTPRAKDDRRDRRRRSRQAGREVRTGDRTTPERLNGATDEAPAPTSAGDEPRSDRSEHQVQDGRGSETTAPARPRRRRGGRRRGRGAAQTPKEAQMSAETGKGPGSTPEQTATSVALAGDDHDPDRLQEEGETLMDVALEDQGHVAERFLRGLLDVFGVEGRISLRSDPDDDRIDVRIDGDGLGMLIGPKGNTLLAVQELTRTVVQHHTSARNGRLYVDVAGYREKRAAALAEFTRKVAADVIRSGHPVALEPMNAADRKLVHDTVTSIDGVTTHSVGEDERRHVVIAPAVAMPAPSEDVGADG
jgi:spoIIIJ-associated protein